jgi:hypothetical protein
MKRRPRSVVLRGEGYGSTASVTLETSDGREAALVYFVPQSQRQESKDINGQLEYVRFLAAPGTGTCCRLLVRKDGDLRSHREGTALVEASALIRCKEWLTNPCNRRARTHAAEAWR